MCAVHKVNQKWQHLFFLHQTGLTKAAFANTSEQRENSSQARFEHRIPCCNTNALPFFQSGGSESKQEEKQIIYYIIHRTYRWVWSSSYDTEMLHQKVFCPSIHTFYIFQLDGIAHIRLNFSKYYLKSMANNVFESLMFCRFGLNLFFEAHLNQTKLSVGP